MKTHANLTALSVVVLIFSLLSSPLVSGKDFIAGKHFRELSTAVNDKNEVREFFSFYCPGCYRHEPIIATLKTKLPTGVSLIKNHIDGMPGREQIIEEALSKALLTAKLLQVEDEITAAIFNYIHVNKAVFSDEEDIKNIFLLHDIDEQRFDKTFNSFSVRTGVKKMQLLTEILRKQGLSRVPTVIVNGKYQVDTEHIETQAQYNDLILYLLTK